MSTRRFLLAGNWKMHLLVRDLSPYFAEFSKILRDNRKGDESSVEIAFAMSYLLLPEGARLAKEHGYTVCAQNVHAKPSGAFTGEVSCQMLAEAGVTWSLVGHSERRQYYNETNQSVAEKTSTLLASHMTPIVCIGETQAERDGELTNAVIEKQLTPVFEQIVDFENVVLAYEPVWAIGTGRTASSAEAQEVHQFVRRLLSQRYGHRTADRVRILYGGSAKPDNIEELLRQPDIDGGLVGGASLKAQDFAMMVKTARQVATEKV